MVSVPFNCALGVWSLLLLGLQVASQPSGRPGLTFVHLFEWSWDDIAQECEDWLGPKGFTAVQISPPNEHSSLKSWIARYQPVSYALTSRSGNETQLAAMIKRCKDAGVGVYADVVSNQMAPYGGVGVAGTSYKDRTYPPTYGPDDFHHLPGDKMRNCGVDNYHDKYNIQYCDLLGMPDLCTGCDHVQRTISAFITGLGKLGISGFRIDAAKHQNATELGEMLSRVDPSLYRFLEVLKMPNEPVLPQEYFGLGEVTEIGYGNTLGYKFIEPGRLGDDMASLGEAWGLMPGKEAVVFIDNHDTQRTSAELTYKNGYVYTMASVFMLAWPYGFPKVMSSYAFSSPDQGPPSSRVHGANGKLNCGTDQPWVCEHRWLPIANMVAWRRSAGNAKVTNWFTDAGAGGNMLSFCRGSVACVAFNRDDSRPWDAVLQFTLPAGAYCDVAQSDGPDCPIAHMGADGTLRVSIPPLAVVAFHVGAKPHKSREFQVTSATLADIPAAATHLSGAVAAIALAAISISALVYLRWSSLGTTISASEGAMSRDGASQQPLLG